MEQSSGRFSTFSVADLFFGIDALRVREVLRFQSLTPANLDDATRKLIRGAFRWEQKLLLVVDPEQIVDAMGKRAKAVECDNLPVGGTVPLIVR